MPLQEVCGPLIRRHDRGGDDRPAREDVDALHEAHGCLLSRCEVRLRDRLVSLPASARERVAASPGVRYEERLGAHRQTALLDVGLAERRAEHGMPPLALPWLGRMPCS